MEVGEIMASQAPKMDNVSKLMLLLSLLAILAVVYVLVLSLINTYKRNSLKGEVDNTQLVLNAENNIKPVGFVAEAGAVVANAAGRPPKEIYDGVCAACHATGVLEAPKLGDKAAWETRAANGVGIAGLLKSAIAGKGSMPAKGGDPSITDSELEAVILYITKESGLDLGGAADAPKVAEKPEENKQAVEETVAVEPTKVDSVPAAPITPAAPKAEEAPAAPVAAAAPAKDNAEGKKVYDTACFACHASGVAGSPKLGDTAAWAPRIALGIDALYESSIKGKGAMPPKGGNMSLEDSAIKAAVDYMVSQAK